MEVENIWKNSDCTEEREQRQNNSSETKREAVSTLSLVLRLRGGVVEVEPTATLGSVVEVEPTATVKEQVSAKPQDSSTQTSSTTTTSRKSNGNDSTPSPSQTHPNEPKLLNVDHGLDHIVSKQEWERAVAPEVTRERLMDLIPPHCKVPCVWRSL